MHECERTRACDIRSRWPLACLEEPPDTTCAQVQERIDLFALTEACTASKVIRGKRKSPNRCPNSWKIPITCHFKPQAPGPLACYVGKPVVQGCRRMQRAKTPCGHEGSKCLARCNTPGPNLPFAPLPSQPGTSHSHQHQNYPLVLLPSQSCTCLYLK